MEKLFKMTEKLEKKALAEMTKSLTIKKRRSFDPIDFLKNAPRFNLKIFNMWTLGQIWGKHEKSLEKLICNWDQRNTNHKLIFVNIINLPIFVVLRTR